jgi:uncharacterized protein (DUF1697 family)
MALTHMVALLRGINVGKAKRIAMADLRTMLESLGHTNVATLLNSGNALFSTNETNTANVAQQIETAIMATFGFPSRTTVITASDVAQIIAEDTLSPITTNPSRYFVTILNNPTDRLILEPLTHQSWEPEAFALGTRVAYCWCPNGVLDSQVLATIGRLLPNAITTRNWATMKKIQTLLVQDI